MSSASGTSSDVSHTTCINMASLPLVVGINPIKRYADDVSGPADQAQEMYI